MLGWVSIALWLVVSVVHARDLSCPRIENRKEILPLNEVSDLISSALQIPDTSLLLLGTNNGYLEVWDYKNSEILLKIDIFREAITTITALNKLNQVILSNGQELRFFNFSTGNYSDPFYRLSEVPRVQLVLDLSLYMLLERSI